MHDPSKPAQLIAIFGKVTLLLNGTHIEARPDGGFTARTGEGKLIAAWSPEDEKPGAAIDLLIEQTQPDLSSSEVARLTKRRTGEYQSDGGNEQNVAGPAPGA